MPNDVSELDLGTILGVTEGSSVQQLTLYIPDKDTNGKTIENLQRWIKKAQNVLTIIGRGSTTMPPTDGTWLLNKNIDSVEELKDKDILREKTILIYTYIDPDRFEKNLKSLRVFLHEFGRETNQGEVLFEFYGKLYRIEKYDSKQRF